MNTPMSNSRKLDDARIIIDEADCTVIYWADPLTTGRWRGKYFAWACEPNYTTWPLLAGWHSHPHPIIACRRATLEAAVADARRKSRQMFAENCRDYAQTCGEYGLSLPDFLADYTVNHDQGQRFLHGQALAGIQSVLSHR